jgi:4-hydroxy-tetrahydrodipicolinate reductase
MTKKLQIALLGYGKMGKIIESVCLERGHEIACIIDNERDWTQKESELKNCDIAIDFSIPEMAFANMKRCFELKIPVVVGTTGWYNQKNEVTELCKKNDAALFHAPNFSLGMNIVFRLNRQLGKMLNGTSYRLSMNEIHHIHKLDAPSGTAIQLANDLIDSVDCLKKWEIDSEASTDTLPIIVSRVSEVNGTHEVIADSEEDIISLKHEAKSRRGFGLGAVLAAEFLYGKKGIYTMDDLLDQHY